MRTTITDAELLDMLARAEPEEERWAEATRQCGSAYNARRYGHATHAAQLIRTEVSRRIMEAAEAMLDA